MRRPHIPFWIAAFTANTAAWALIYCFKDTPTTLLEWMAKRAAILTLTAAGIFINWMLMSRFFGGRSSGLRVFAAVSLQVILIAVVGSVYNSAAALALD